MKSENVWISRAMQDSTLMKPITGIEDEKDEEQIVDAIRRNKKGEPLPAHRFPKRLHGIYKDKRIQKLPDVFSGGGFWLVSEDCAEVLRQFNLGKSSLYQAEVFQSDRKTPVEGKYFHLNFGETKQAFLPNETPNVHVHSASPNLEPTGYWDLRSGIVDGEVALDRSALDGPDL